MKETTHSALLEIGVEELPARFITPALEQLRDELLSGLKSFGMENAEVETWGTPRRLTAILPGLPLKGKDRTELVIGPPPSAAKDENGRWTKAATGFAKSQKVPVQKLEIQDTPKGQRLVALHQFPGQKTDLFLKELFPSVIKKLAFPKSMIWESSGFRFARPIRWIVALYNSTVIRFQVAGLSSDRNTVGLLALGGKKIPIPNPDRYKTLLQNRCILVDPKDRQASLFRQLESVTKKVKGSALISPEHVEEVVNLTEYPVGILGEFPESYLKLPKDVLISVLRKHQKFFPVEIRKGKLTHHFVGIRNGLSEHQDEVRNGYERVLNARLADAQFFYEKDSHLSLDALSARLSEVVFQERLGTLADKSNRTLQFIEQVGHLLNLPTNVVDSAKRAAKLAKADLLTQMVGEFPELQGIAGRFYAEMQEPEVVANAIEQHYWPLTSEGPLPQSSEAALVALADKMDTLAGHFSVGLVPTGSADPYAHRRLAVGVIRILLDKKWTLSLPQLVDLAFSLLPSDNQKGKTELKEFFRQRLINWFTHQQFKIDEVEAILANKVEDLATVAEKLASLKAVRERSEFDALSIALKRATNILKQAEERGISFRNVEFAPAGLGEPEKNLRAALNEHRPRLTEALENRDYNKAFLDLASLKEPVDRFFEDVMVMVDDEHPRAQRLALLLDVKKLFETLADISKLQPLAAP
ncbi:MAG: glycine--tRNA ligase subunit beta [Elusimicrobia bacterium]|nr:glycine--tRNA ligase subunit beta [Candidatus Obscuribacterium magneticum]